MRLPVTRLVGAVCGIMLVVVLLQGALPPPAPPVPPPAPPARPCIGSPIEVAYPFSGWLEPHACAVQCEDDKPRYILYKDGKATQCQTPPGCNDEGEDRGILCTPPVTTLAS